MNLTALMDALEAFIGEDGPVEWPEPAPHAYRWWEPSMRLPAVYHWMVPGSTREPDVCTVEDTLRITVSIAARPGASSGEDATNLEAYADAYVAAIDATLKTRGGLPIASGRRLGLGLATDRLGDTTVLVLEIPLELTLESNVNPA